MLLDSAAPTLVLSSENMNEVAPQESFPAVPAEDSAATSYVLGPERKLQIETLQTRLKLKFHRLELLDQALTHASFVHETNLPEKSLLSNETLEFLGDAVLGLAVSHYLSMRFPKYHSGELTKLKGAVVSRTILAKRARQLDLGGYLLLGKGEELESGRTKASIIANALEALIGALFLDSGWETARQWILDQVKDEIEELNREQHKLDFKSLLQEYTQTKFQTVPRYTVVGEEGPPHQKFYEIELWFKDQLWGRGEGKSKKVAQQRAAQEAWEKIQANSLPSPED